MGRTRCRPTSRWSSRQLITATVEICLATYNGEKYLANFYTSIAAQSHVDWRLLVRDDGSSDSTWGIVEKLAIEDSRVVPIVDRFGNLGVSGNFSALLGRCTGTYVMLADQDDIWYADKIQDSLQEIRALQARSPDQERPLLVFTDVHVVDAELNVVSESFIRMQGLESLRCPSFVQLLTQNVAPGCTMIMNRSLVDAALPIPAEAAMHDWWLMLVAAAIGEISFVPSATMAYRQHGTNLVGAKSPGLLGAAARIATYRTRLQQAQLQAGKLVNRYADRMRTGDVAAASALEALSRLPIGLRQIEARRRGLRKAGVLRNIAFFLLM